MEFYGIDLGWLLGWITLLSLGTLLIMAIAIPWVVTRLPADYFSNPRREPWRKSGEEPLLAVIGGLLKNALGAVLIVLGLVLLFTPGQGLLTMLAGVMIMNFPGKFKLERWLVLNTGVLRPLNWLRQQRSQAPFETPVDKDKGRD